MERRRSQRYRLRLALRIIRCGEQLTDRVVNTRNISSGGVCFVSPAEVEAGARIEYLITLSHAVTIHCEGKVVRALPVSERQWEVGVTMEWYQFVRADEAGMEAITAKKASLT